MAGEIEEVGKAVKTFKQGDQVFGLSEKFGAHAEYICLSEEAAIVTKPVNMNYEEAAAVCDGLMLGYNLIKEIYPENKTTFPVERKKILIYGASGSIGTATVQLARYYDAEVTAVCNTKSLELVKSLGVSKVIDYTKEDFTKDDQIYDVVIDAVGKSSFFHCKNLLKKNGIYFSTDLGFLIQNPFLALWTTIFGRLPSGKKVLFPIPKINKKNMQFFKELIEAGKYKAVIDRRYTLEQIVEATRYVETEQKTGNVVIVIAHKN